MQKIRTNFYSLMSKVPGPIQALCLLFTLVLLVDPANTAYNPQPPLGQALSAASIPVVPASDSTTTTTYSRPMRFTGTFVPAAAYATQQNMGGQYFTLATGLGAGAKVRLRRISQIITATTVSAAATPRYFFFNAVPTTTFTDATNTTFAAADAAIFVDQFSVGLTTTAFIGAATGSSSDGAASTDRTIIADASGNIYFAIESTGTTTLTSPTHFNWTVEIVY